LEELEWNDTPREAYDYMRDCLETQTERWERQQREKAWAAAFEEYKAKHPDLDDAAEDVPTEAAPEPVTVPVAEPETKKDEAVDLIRMGPFSRVCVDSKF
jgi:transketolase